jgi:hypothetical protein
MAAYRALCPSLHSAGTARSHIVDERTSCSMWVNWVQFGWKGRHFEHQRSGAHTAGGKQMFYVRQTHQTWGFTESHISIWDKICTEPIFLDDGGEEICVHVSLLEAPRDWKEHGKCVFVYCTDLPSMSVIKKHFIMKDESVSQLWRWEQGG